MSQFTFKGRTFRVLGTINDVTNNCGLAAISNMQINLVGSGFDRISRKAFKAAVNSDEFDRALLDSNYRGNKNQFVLSGRANSAYESRRLLPNELISVFCHDEILSVMVNSRRGAVVRGFGTDNTIHPGSSIVQFILWTPQSRVHNIVQPYIYKRVPKKLGNPDYWKLDSLKKALTVAHNWFKCKETVDESRFT